MRAMRPSKALSPEPISVMSPARRVYFDASFVQIGLPGPEEPGNCHPIAVTLFITAVARIAVCRCTASIKATSIAVSATILARSTNSGFEAPEASGACQDE